MRTNPAAVQRCGGRQLAAGNWTRNVTHGLDTGEGNHRLTSIFISPRLAPSVSRGFVEETPQFQPVVTLRNSATCNASTMFILARDINDSHLSKEQERRLRYNIAVYGRLQSPRLEAPRIRASVALVVSMWNELVQMRGSWHGSRLPTVGTRREHPCLCRKNNKESHPEAQEPLDVWYRNVTLNKTAGINYRGPARALAAM
jgi:hypothetical protein